MKYITHFSRIFIGVLFIISGWVKLNDPMGFSFKLEEYFSVDVLNMPIFEPVALPIALIVVIAEILLGVALLVGFKPKLTLWLLMLMIVFFTFLTFYSAYFNKVTDCGCFGDAVPLKPWESFAKDIILLVFIILLFVGIRFIKPIVSVKGQATVLLVALAVCIWLGNHVLNHLPMIDFRPYAIGKSIPEGMKTAEELGKPAPEYQVIYTLINESTSETKQVTDTEYIDDKWWEDKSWKIESDLTESVMIKEGYEPPIHDFSIVNDEGEWTETILQAEAYLLAISYKLEKSDVEGFKKIADLAWKAEEKGIPTMGMTGVSGPEVEDFKHNVQAPFEFSVTDPTTLKTIIRANPGLVYLKKGVIVGKWHYNDVPTVEELLAL